MTHADTRFAQENHRPIDAPPKGVAIDRMAIGVLCIGAALWIGSALGLDPTNVPQRQDFERFHFPSIRVFAEKPFMDAVADYPAAPFPLFYLLSGWLFHATGSILALQVWTVALALGLLLCVYGLAHARFDGSRAQTLLLFGAVLVSPYFRGQSVYANTDLLALFLAFAAIWMFGDQPARFPNGRTIAALVLACCAVYTRQFYVFLPVYLFIRICVAVPWSGRLVAALLCAALALPVLGLVLFWGGVTPPRFREHAAGPSLGDSIPAVILLLSFYALPLATVTVWRHRTAFLRALRSWSLLLMAAPFLALGVFLLVRGEAIPDVVGGGMPLHFLRVLPIPASAKIVLLAAAVAVGGTYLAYLIRQDPLRNLILALIALCFAPTAILYQRYFDPLMPLVFAVVLSTREMSAPTRQTVLVLIFALEVAVAVVGMAHYRAVFWGGAG
jgi:hypothetical protein